MTLQAPEALYQFLLQQQVAEAYLEDIDLRDPLQVREALRRGNNRFGFADDSGKTKWTEEQITELLARYDIMHQLSDLPTTGQPGTFAGTGIPSNTGFSATLLYDRETNQYTLAMRSTEYKSWSAGGDWERDGIAGADGDIAATGFAWAQIDAMEKYYAWLKSSGTLPPGATLNVTGFSLGGHLATVFTELHAQEVNQTVTFNGAGRGRWNTSRGDLAAMLADFRNILANPAADPGDADPTYQAALGLFNANAPLDPVNIQRDARFLWAARSVARQFGSVGSLNGAMPSNPNRTGLTNGADAKITQVWGQEFPVDNSWVANTGVHGPARGVFIEAQPLVAGWPQGPWPIGGPDYGAGHSIILLGDSLAVMRELTKLDPTQSLDTLAALFTRATALQPTGTLVGDGSSATSEYDALENVLDALRRAFLGQEVSRTPFASGGLGFSDLQKRNQFYNNLKQLADDTKFQSVAGKLNIAAITSGGAVVTAAKTDFGEFIALKSLAPFALKAKAGVEGAQAALESVWLAAHAEDYSAWLADVALPATERGQGKETFTDGWYADRSQMLSRLLQANESNTTGALSRRPGDSDSLVFIDRASETQINVGRAPAMGLDSQFVIFGSEGSETGVELAGGGLRDRIYGGGGNDHIFGYAGNDHLEGNAGADWLYGGAGDDVLVGGAGIDDLSGEGDNDVLIGGDGGDFLRGGTGRDILKGGAGRDNYFLTTADTHADLIDDSENDGLLVVDGISIGSFVRRGDGVFDSDSGQYRLVLQPQGDGSSSAQLIRVSDGRRLAEIRNVTASKVLDYNLPGSTAPAATLPGTSRSDDLDVVTWQRDGNGGVLPPSVASSLAVSGGDSADILTGGTYLQATLDGGEGTDFLYTNPLGIATDVAGRVTTLNGGGGSDFIHARRDTNIVNAGTGNDYINAQRFGYGPGANMFYQQTNGDWVEALDLSGHSDELLYLIAGQRIGLTPAPMTGNVANYDPQLGRMRFSYQWYTTGTATSGTDYVMATAGTGPISPTSILQLRRASDPTSVSRVTSVAVGSASVPVQRIDGVWHSAEAMDVLAQRADGVTLRARFVYDRWFYSDADLQNARRDAWDSVSDITVVDAGEGDDIVEGGAGKDIVSGGDGSDRIDGAGGEDILRGEVGRDLIFGGAYDDYIDGGADDDELYGDYPVFSDGSDVLATERLGNDEIRGGGGNDRLFGNGGDDWLFGGEGNDVLDGGRGNDQLFGGDESSTDRTGADTFLWGRGEGNDVVIERDRSSSAMDVIRFKTGVGPTDVSMERSGNDLILRVTGSTDTLTIRDQFSTDGSNSILVEAIQWEDAPGVTWRLRNSLGATVETATPQPGPIVGTPFDDEIGGTWSNDTLIGTGGNDTLVGGGGNDILDGGTGNDVLNGGTGDNVFRFGRGDGEDEMIRPPGDRVLDGGVWRDARNIIEMKSGISPSDLAFSWFETGPPTIYSKDLLITIKGTQDSILVRDVRGGVNGLMVDLQIRFVDHPGLGIVRGDMAYQATNEELDYQYSPGLVVPHQSIVGTDGKDELIGARNNNSLTGGTGDDRLLGLGGNDTLVGGDGADVLLGGSGHDKMQGESGDDYLDGGPGSDWLDGGTGNDHLLGGEGNDLLEGGEGDDYFDGGPGNDTFEFGLQGGVSEGAGLGSDTYLFRRGSGSDTVHDYNTAGNGYNAIVFEGLIAAELAFSASGEDLRIQIAGTADQLVIRHFFKLFGDVPLAGNPPASRYGEPELSKRWQFKFSDGTVWSLNDVAQRAAIGTPGNDHILRGDANDQISAGAGDDVIYGGDGEDQIDAGAGNDIIYASRGRDEILFGRGDGADLLTWDRFNDLNGRDVLVFKSGILPGDIEFAERYGDVVLRIAGTADEVQIESSSPSGYFPGFRIPAAVSEVRFVDDPATIWTWAGVEAQVTGRPSGQWNPGDNSVHGGDGDDSDLAGPAGSAIYGHAGNDVIVVGSGAAAGGPGNDLYRFTGSIQQPQPGPIIEAPGEGIDTLETTSDVAALPENVENLRMISYTYEGVPWGSRVANGNAGNNTITGNGLDNVIDAKAGDDILSSSGGRDILRGGTGDDLIYASGDGATFEFGRGDGQDTIINGAGTEATGTLKFDAGVGEADVLLSRGTDAQANDLIVAIPGTGDRVTVRDHFAVLNGVRTAGISSLLFSSGVQLSRSQIDSLAGSPTSPPPPPPPPPPTGGTIVGTAGNDTLVGSAGNDALYGLGGYDYLGGEAGNDLLDGGDGDDYLVGWLGDDQLYGGPGQDSLLGNEGDDLLDGGTAGTYADYLQGGPGNDQLISDGSGATFSYARGDGNDVIENRTLAGSAAGTLSFLGSDLSAADVTLVRGTGDALNDLLITVVPTGHTITVRDHFARNGDLRTGGLSGLWFADNSFWTRADIDRHTQGAGEYPTNWDDTLQGTAGNDWIRAYAGNDTVHGDAGDDQLYGDEGDDRLHGDGDNDYLSGGEGNDMLYGGSGADTLAGDAGDDVLDGGSPGQYTDYLIGGLGNDRLVSDGSGAFFSYARGDGNDVIENRASAGSASGTLSFLGSVINAADLSLVRGSGPESNDLIVTIAVTGHTLRVRDHFLRASGERPGGLSGIWFSDNSFWSRQDIDANTFGSGGIATEGNDVLYGFEGNDTLSGLGGDDTLYGDAGDDILNGNAGNDQLFGERGNDRLDGGAGEDTMAGGVGDDVYVVDDAGDMVIELANEGTDRVESSVSYTLGAEVDNLTLTGTAAINGTGNALANTLTGNAADNVLDGGAGADYLAGGLGNDVYIVDHASDVVSEAAGAGVDTVRSSVSHTLGANVENLELLGTAAINGTGNTLANTLVGNSANNTLNGGSGADVMRGGAGNDTYIVDNAGDVVVENPGEGIDLVQASVSYTLGAAVENLTLTGTSAINATGNALANVLTGNSGANRLDGGLGADAMAGGGGNDVYVVDHAGDVVTEAASAGTDRVESSISYTLGANVENLTLTGTANIDGTGNSAVNTINGNAGNNRINGGAGADTMAGGAGDDTYVVDNTADKVNESSGAGTDLIESSVTFTLGSNVEHLTLTGTAAINGTGTTLANYVKGNSGANTLNGGGGNDVLQGGAGNDTLTDTSGRGVYDGGDGADALTGGTDRQLFAGGAGNDTLTLGGGADIIAFNRGHGADSVTTPATGTGQGETNDTLTLAGIRYSELRLARSGNDLLVKVAGTTDSVRFTGWYAAAGNKTVSTLQMLVDSTADYNAGSADALVNRRVVRLNFGSIVSAFDAAYTANPSIGDWAIPTATLTSARTASSDTDAIGGQLAYRYGSDGNLAGLDFATAQSVIGNTSFATAVQSIGSGPTSGSVQLMRAPAATLIEPAAMTADTLMAAPVGTAVRGPWVMSRLLEEQQRQSLAGEDVVMSLPEQLLVEGGTPEFASIELAAKLWRGRSDVPELGGTPTGTAEESTRQLLLDDRMVAADEMPAVEVCDVPDDADSAAMQAERRVRNTLPTGSRKKVFLAEGGVDGAAESLVRTQPANGVRLEEDAALMASATSASPVEQQVRHALPVGDQKRWLEASPLSGAADEMLMRPQPLQARVIDESQDEAKAVLGTKESMIQLSNVGWFGRKAFGFLKRADLRVALQGVDMPVEKSNPTPLNEASTGGPTNSTIDFSAVRRWLVTESVTSSVDRWSDMEALVEEHVVGGDPGLLGGEMPRGPEQMAAAVLAALPDDKLIGSPRQRLGMLR